MFVQTEQAFQLKGGMLPYTKLQLNTLDVNKVHEHLNTTTKTAPRLFQQMPVILDITALPSVTQAELKPIVTLLSDFGLVPFAMEGQVAEPIAMGQSLLPLLGQIRNHAPARKNTEDAAMQNLVIERNVRSGQQLVAEKGDLIVWGSVSAGAEVMASGCVHVYGRLYGKAMAGMKGQKEARIFANGFAPELVAIAGIYALSEQIPAEANAVQSAVCVTLQQDQLLFNTL